MPSSGLAGRATEMRNADASRATVVLLAQPLFVGAPHYPTHPPFMYTLTRLHGMVSYGDGVSAASDAIAMVTHMGTHIDSVFHISKDGNLHGGVEAAQVQTYGGGIRVAGVPNTPPVVGRGLLLDIVALDDVNRLAPDLSHYPGRRRTLPQSDRSRDPSGRRRALPDWVGSTLG